MNYNKMKVPTTINDNHSHFAFYDQSGEGTTSNPMDKNEDPIDNDKHTHQIINFKILESNNHSHSFNDEGN
jgi:hypothetical protein